ncbi:sushi, von Willebrand factor type A, EGF and pentraxin domain-containing protein 1-like isoform X2 [Anabas testudineus]|uniref:sushi, von Willebrand factor type A, EGF and pentraxin domain-containing protein 1-like isoform X2 n=1 Tax=Anabas testudineus TaxID=64144 RepID=UPI000E45F476|nr:sushi, von Willebrand factor type A, EGF and pentraxin domain-containing protein 1-like isoform X2 [Anabas testudineus]
MDIARFLLLSCLGVAVTAQGKNCGPAGEVTNGRIDYPEGTEFGDKAVITCDTGYTLVGEREITCEDHGWSHRLPECEVVTCDPPPEIVNGAFTPSKDSYVYLDAVQYSCENYYTLIGSKSRTCSEDGTFKPDPPTCIDQTCPRPVPGPNMNVKGNKMLLEKFPDGTKASFACDVGYTSAAGSPVVTCAAGSWSPVTLKCERKNCGPAGEVTNGRIDYPEGTEFGDKAVITCDTGYTLVGEREITCEDHGWSHRLPECEVVTCDPPPEIVNGAFTPSKDSYVYLDAVQYSCENYYTLIGSKSRTCSEDGTFKPDPPTCIDQTCPRPVPGPNMNVKGNKMLLEKFPDGTKASFACDVGYTSAAGSPVVTCAAGSWSPVTLKCERKNCGPAGEVTNGRIDYPEGTEFGDKAVITCDTGYTLVGEREITCEDHGWSHRLPECEVVTCDPPPEIVNGAFTPSKDSYVYLDAVQYSCENYYTLIGSKSRTCSEDGTFKPDPPTCIDQTCPRPVPGPNMNVKGNKMLLEKFPDGTKASFACDVGYTSAAGSPVVTCAAGHWSPVTLKCERKNCGPAGEVTNGRIDYPEGTEFGDKAVITCDTGYALVGEREITCEDHGWSHRLPECEVVTCDPPPEIVNGAFTPSKDSYVYLDAVQYSCENYYTLIGSKSRTCSEDGTFKPDHPTCIDQTCPRPVPGPNMNVKGNKMLLEKFPDGTKASFACDVGYTSAAGSPVVTCAAGSWSPVTLKCERKNCGPAGEVTDGHVDYPEGTEFGDKAVITCFTGFTLVGESERICGDHGWSGRLPDCEVVTCDPPPEIVNGAFTPSKDSYVYLDVVQYSCEKYYTLIGSKTRTCSEDGTFKPDPPACVDQNCPRPVPGPNMNVKENIFYLEKFPDGTKVSFACDVGYTSAAGSPVVTCAAGSWSPVTLRCKKKSCGLAGKVTNGRIDYPKGKEFGDKAVIVCDSGYTLAGASEITCGDQGWSGSLPICEASGNNSVVLASVAGISVLIGAAAMIIARQGNHPSPVGPI